MYCFSIAFIFILFSILTLYKCYSWILFSTEATWKWLWAVVAKNCHSFILKCDFNNKLGAVFELEQTAKIMKVTKYSTLFLMFQKGISVLKLYLICKCSMSRAVFIPDWTFFVVGCILHCSSHIHPILYQALEYYWDSWQECF